MSRHSSSLSCSPGAAVRETCKTALPRPGPEGTDGAELGREFTGGFSGHIGVKQLAFLGREVVGQGAPETRAFDGFGDHGVSPPVPSRSWRRRLISVRSSFTNGGVKTTGLPSLARRTS